MDKIIDKTLFDFNLEIFDKTILNIYIANHYDSKLGEYWGITIISMGRTLLNYVS